MLRGDAIAERRRLVEIASQDDRTVAVDGGFEDSSPKAQPVEEPETEPAPIADEDGDDDLPF